MNVLGIIATAGRFIAGEEYGTDSKGVTTHSAWWPETAEIVYGTIATVLVVGLIVKFGGPAVKKAMAARTERIQKELDAAAADKAAAATEAEQIRRAKGDIEAERARILGEAQEQAAVLLRDGRARLAAEVEDLEAKTSADIAASGSRASDELRAEISRLSMAAVDHVVTGTLDDATHQELIESFISRVGAAR